MDVGALELKELVHVRLAIHNDMEKVPGIKRWPPREADVFLEAVRAVIPPWLFNLLAIIVGATSSANSSDTFMRVENTLALRILSFAQDIVSLESRDQTLTMTLRHCIGSEVLGKVMHGLGHCCSYDTTLRMETAYAQPR